MRVLRVVARRHGVLPEYIASQSKIQAHRDARRRAEYALRHHAGLSWGMIGRMLGRKPENVLDSVRLLEQRGRRDDAIRDELRELMGELES